MKAFLDELKRRNVIRVGGIYVVAGWILMQAAALLEDALSLPAWFDTIIVSLILLGFPVVVLFAWLYEVTPEGLRRTPAVDTPEGQAFAASTRRRLDRTLIAGIFLAVGVIAADRLLTRATPPASAAATEGAAARSATSQASAPPESQRVAFFGFTPTSDDPAAKAMAEAATDQMFQTMGLNKLDTAARTETLDTPKDRRFARAGELGALYALSGDVRPDKGGMTLSIRFEDVPSRMTLWEESFSGPASEAGLLPAQAAWPTSQVMRCIRRFRSSLTQDTPKLLKQVADRCRAGTYLNDSNRLQMVSRARDLAQADPGSAYIQAFLVVTLAGSVATAPASARPALVAEAEAALKRATELDPKLPFLIQARMYVAEAKAIPLGEFNRLVLDTLAQAEGKDAVVFSQTNLTYARLLQAVGRWREALPYASAMVANDPGQLSTTPGHTYAVLGQSSRARAEYEQAFALDPSVTTWSNWSFAAIFLGAGDADAMLKSPPSFVPDSAVDCFRDIRKAYVSKDAKVRNLGARRASECGGTGDLPPVRVLASLAALGDLDGAFALAGGQQKLDASFTSFRTSPLGALWWPTSRAMRNDPRFLPLVEQQGLMDYWRATRTRPDVCETEDVPFCRELKAAAKP